MDAEIGIYLGRHDLQSLIVIDKEKSGAAIGTNAPAQGVGIGIIPVLAIGQVGGHTGEIAAKVFHEKV